MDIETLQAENKALRDINARQKEDHQKLIASIHDFVDIMRNEKRCELTPYILQLQSIIARFQ